MRVTVWNFGLILKSDRLKFSCPEVTAQTNWKKKDSSSFLARTQQMKSHGLFVYHSPPKFLCISIKVFSFAYHAFTCMYLTLVSGSNSQFFADPAIHLCWRNIR